MNKMINSSRNMNTNMPTPMVQNPLPIPDLSHMILPGIGQPPKNKKGNKVSRPKWSLVVSSNNVTTAKLGRTSYNIQIPISGKIVAFTQKPLRQIELLDATEFVALWNKSLPNGFGKNSPNAIIDFRKPGLPNYRGSVAVVVVRASVSNDKKFIDLRVITNELDKKCNIKLDKIIPIMKCFSIFIDF